MFIELTDHLRCPAPHPEHFLVLLPDEIVARSVLTGRLGCPVCGRTYAVIEGVAELGAAPDLEAGHALEAGVAHVLLGLQGPGGYAVLVGSAASTWRELAELNPGVALVAVNPPGRIAEAAPVLSVLRSSIIPLKSRSMRGVVLGGEFSAAPTWIAEAGRVTLPGLRVVGLGPEPAVAELDLLASAEGCWVATPSGAAPRHYSL